MSKAPSGKEKIVRIDTRIREAGERASAEAVARRTGRQPSTGPKEIGGAGGPEPTRYGDWERKGVISDF
jgi:hypothetical protein